MKNVLGLDVALRCVCVCVEESTPLCHLVGEPIEELPLFLWRNPVSH
jgi:hypothetical protein